MKLSPSILLPLSLLWLAPLRPAAAQTYTVTGLGTLPGGTFSQAAAINNLGHVTGTADTDRPERAYLAYLEKNLAAKDRSKYVARTSHVFIWDGSSLRDLTGDGMQWSVGNALNDLDAVVGIQGDGEGDTVPGYWGGKINSPPANDYGIASSVNNRGEVSGSRYDYFRQTGEHPFATGQQLDKEQLDIDVLHLPRNSAEATGINDAGLVVGSADVSAKPGTKPRHAVLWRNGVRQDLGTLGGTESRALAVNAPGQIVGVSSVTQTATDGNSLYHAFFWDRGKMADLGTLPGDRQSGAAALNARGEVVGSSGERACLWRGGKAYDLNALLPVGSGWVLQGAAGINNRGQIVGTGLHGGKKRGYLLTPKL